MKNQNAVVSLQVAQPINENVIEPKKEGHRFEIFKGMKLPSGTVIKIRPMGTAYLQEGMSTYIVRLKTLLKDPFYLLPNRKGTEDADFVILTREEALVSGRKYFWNKVGIGKHMNEANKGLVSLKWDLFSDDVYMSLHPKTPKSGYEDVPDFEAA